VRKRHRIDLEKAVNDKADYYYDCGDVMFYYWELRFN